VGLPDDRPSPVWFKLI